MNKNIDEQLFIRLHQLPHFLRGKMEEAHGPEGHDGHEEHEGPKRYGQGGRGSMGKGGFGRPMGHGPEGREGGPMGRRPEGHGPEGERKGHGPGGCEEREGHGPEGERKGHGPEGERRGPKPLSRERILSVLLKQEGGVRQKVLAEKLHVNPSSISEFVDLLEGGGYITREVDPSDKRATLISLTEKGRARAYELEDEKKDRYTKLFEVLTEDEKQELLKLLEKLMEK